MISLALADGLLVAASALAAFAAIRIAFPLLERYALARPNARSSHTMPTAQGGGTAVIAATLAAAWIGWLIAPPHPELGLRQLSLVTTAVLTLATIGLVDDLRPMSVLPRLAAQMTAACLLVAALPASARALPLLPPLVEQTVLVIGLMWFVNLTNFMDGIDEMTLAQMVPLAAAMVVVTHLGILPGPAGVLALAMLGALIGFAPFNRHVARLFLGDVGSLALGGLAGWLLILLAGRGHLAAALLIPLYYLADATITLARRWWRGERLTVAHRSHFYQTATARGFTVPDVVGRVNGLNLLLALLALATVLIDAPSFDALAVIAGMLATIVVLAMFERGPR